MKPKRQTNSIGNNLADAGNDRKTKLARKLWLRIHSMLHLTKLISNQLGLQTGKCRFYPTCSDYSYIAIKRHGIIKGGFFTIKRVLKCHPLSKGGYDPVPSTNER